MRYSFTPLGKIDASGKFDLNNINATDTVVYKVLPDGSESWQAIEVWWYPETQSASCTRCSSILVAMSSSCKHARALRRFLKR